MRFRSACAALGVALVGVTLLGFGTASAAVAAPLKGVKIHNLAFNGFRVLGVTDDQTRSGFQLQYQDDADTPGKYWSLEPVTANSFLIRNLNSGMCAAMALGENGLVRQAPCDSRWAEQVWSLDDSGFGTGRYHIVNQSNNQCMAPYNTSSNPSDKTNLYVQTCVANRLNQAFYFETR